MPTAILYSGPGVELERDVPDGGVVSMRQVAESAGFQVRTLYRGDALSAADLASADLWLTPAADEVRGRNGYGRYNSNIAIAHYMADMHYTGLVKTAISGGMGYVGCCAGAYWAVNDLALAGLDAQAMETKTQYHEVIAVVDGGATSDYEMDLLDGPYFAFPSSGVSNGVTIVGRYKTPPRRGYDIAMITSKVDAGRTFLSGPHPEAALSWGSEAHWQDTAANVAKNRQFLADWMKRVARGAP